MAPRATRSKAKAAPVKTEEEALAATSSTAQKHKLQTPSSDPPKLFILPKDTGKDARIVTLAQPRTDAPSRWFVCPGKGFYEFTRVSSPQTSAKSFLLTPERELETQTEDKSGQSVDSEYDSSKGYVTSHADVFIATPFDSLFLVLPALSSYLKGRGDEKALFLTSEDYYDRLYSASPQLRSLLRHENLQKALASRMAAVCDTVEAGDEVMYRLSIEKLVTELFAKCHTMVKAGLPASMEEKLVRKALETPLSTLKRGDSSAQHELADEEEASGTTTPKTESADSQTTASTADSFSTSVSDASTAATSIATSPQDPTPIVAPEGIPSLLRLRTAFDFLTRRYLPPHLTAHLTTLLSKQPTNSPLPDFSPLTAHLTHLSTLRAQATAARSLDDFSRKRSIEDEEAAMSRADKKRKKEEEEKAKKRNESRGVRELKKVDTKGMKKMSDFFKKKV